MSKSIMSFNLPSEYKDILDTWSFESKTSKSKLVELLIAKEIWERAAARDKSRGIQTTLEIHEAPERARIWGPNKNKCNPKLPNLCRTCWPSVALEEV